MATTVVVHLDIGRDISVTLLDDLGNAANLTGRTVTVSFRKQGRAGMVSRTATIINAGAGEVKYAMPANDLSLGDWDLWWDDSAGNRYPDGDYDTLRVLP